MSPGYWSAQKLLCKMAKDKEVKVVYPIDKLGRRMTNQNQLYMLKRRRAPALGNWFHEMDCADLFVSYFKSGRMTSWNSKWNPDQWDAFAKETGVKYDRKLELEGCQQVVFFEVDKGNETPDGQIREKIEKYLKIDEQTNDPFVVVFTLQDNPGRKSREYVRRTLLEKVFPKFRRGRQFLICNHEDAVFDPLGKHLVCDPGDNARKYSILEL